MMRSDGASINRSHMYSSCARPNHRPIDRARESLDTMPSSTGTERAGTRGVYLLTHPRSASWLFHKMIEKQAAEHSSYYFYRAAFPTRCGLDKGSLSDWSEQDR